MASLKETYNKIAADWHATHSSDTWWVAGTDRFISMLKSGSLVLDAGCGGGMKSKYLIDRGMKVYGTDIAESFIEIAKKTAPAGEYQVLSLEETGKLTKEFDAIFAQASLLHVAKKDILATMKALNSKLKPGGLFYVAVKEVWEGQPDEEVKIDTDYDQPQEIFFSYYTIPELEGYFKQVGLQVVHKQIEKTGKTNWIQIISKKR